MKKELHSAIIYTKYISIYLIAGLCIEQTLSLLYFGRFLGELDWTFMSIIMQLLVFTFLLASSILYSYTKAALGPIESEVDRLHREPAYTRRTIRNWTDERSTEA